MKYEYLTNKLTKIFEAYGLVTVSLKNVESNENFIELSASVKVAHLSLLLTICAGTNIYYLSLGGATSFNHIEGQDLSDDDLISIASDNLELLFKKKTQLVLRQFLGLKSYDFIGEGSERLVPYDTPLTALARKLGRQKILGNIQPLPIVGSNDEN